MNPDAVARAAIPAVPDIRVVERKCGWAVAFVQPRRVELFGDEINAERSAPVPGPLLADTVLADRHVTLVDVLHPIAAIDDAVQRRVARLGDQDRCHLRGQLQDICGHPRAGLGHRGPGNTTQHQQHYDQPKHGSILQLPAVPLHAMFELWQRTQRNSS